MTSDLIKLVHVLYVYADLRLAFSLFDKDHDGFIQLDEVMSVMYALGHRTSQDKMQRMFKDVDMDGKLLRCYTLLY